VDETDDHSRSLTVALLHPERTHHCPPQERRPLVSSFWSNLLVRRVAPRERPSGREARSESSLSLFCRSAPRPNFLKLKRITGHKSLHLQAQLEIAQGRGAEATATAKEA